eukprot:6753530-Ditylum_brightwellii.AAC.1
MESLKTNVNDILSLLQDTNLQHSSNNNNRNRNNCQYHPRNTPHIFTVGCMVSPMVNITQATTVPTRSKNTGTMSPSLIEWAVARAGWNGSQGGRHTEK